MVVDTFQIPYPSHLLAWVGHRDPHLVSRLAWNAERNIVSAVFSSSPPRVCVSLLLSFSALGFCAHGRASPAPLSLLDWGLVSDAVVEWSEYVRRLSGLPPGFTWGKWVMSAADITVVAVLLALSSLREQLAMALGRDGL